MFSKNQNDFQQKFYFKNLAKQNFIREDLCHIKGLRLFCSYSNKETVKTITSNGKSIWLQFRWLYVVVDSGGVFFIFRDGGYILSAGEFT